MRQLCASGCASGDVNSDGSSRQLRRQCGQHSCDDRLNRAEGSSNGDGGALGRVVSQNEEEAAQQVRAMVLRPCWVQAC